jgi:ankyrin repeat protein
MAALTGNSDAINLLLWTGNVDIYSRDTNGKTPLSLAASGGHATLVKLLLGTGKVYINSGDKDGRTPLSVATLYGQVDVAKLLLETSDIDVSLKDKDGQTVEALAAKNGHEAVVKLLQSFKSKMTVALLPISGFFDSGPSCNVYNNLSLLWLCRQLFSHNEPICQQHLSKRSGSIPSNWRISECSQRE